MNLEAKPVCQKIRQLWSERGVVVEVEAKKLLKAGFIREVRYTKWLANVVMVKKNSGG